MASIYALMLAAMIRSFLDDSVMAIKDLTTKANKENKKGARRRIPANYNLRRLCVYFFAFVVFITQKTRILFITG